MAKKKEEKKEDVAPDAAGGKKKSSKLKWIILAFLLLLIGGGGYFAYLKFVKTPAEPGAEAPAVETKEAAKSGHGAPDKSKDAKSGHGASDKAKDGKEKPTVSTALQTFLVNLADASGKRYLKLTLTVEVADEETSKLIQSSDAKIRDTMILLLSSKSYADLTSMENKILLKDEIVDRLNQTLGGSKVLRVYITEMVVQ